MSEPKVVLHFAGFSMRQLGELAAGVLNLPGGVLNYEPPEALSTLVSRLLTLTREGYVKRPETFELSNRLFAALRANRYAACADDDAIKKAFKDLGQDIEELVSMDDNTFERALRHFKFPGYLEDGYAETRNLLVKRGFTFKEESAPSVTESQETATAAPDADSRVSGPPSTLEHTEEGSLTQDERSKDESNGTDTGPKPDSIFSATSGVPSQQ
jgi:hypothetical protein